MGKLAESDIPVVAVYNAIRPAQTGAHPLEYPNLSPEISTQQKYIGQRWARFEDAPEDSLQLEIRARGIASFYLIKTADRFVHADNVESRKLWAQRYTQANIELYGQPEASEVKSMISDDIETFEQATDDAGNLTEQAQAVLAIYQPLGQLGSEQMPSKPEIGRDIQEEYKKLLYEDFGDALEVIDGLSPDCDISPQTTLEVFKQAFEKMRGRDPQKWDGWTFELQRQRNNETKGSKKLFIIGSEKPDTDKNALRNSFVHEILVHGLRAANAAQQPREALRERLPGYLDFEEGLGKWHEIVVGGKLTDVTRDKYIDIALALGIVGPKMSRDEIAELDLNRKIARKQIAGEDYDSDGLITSAWAHVDRIFRGTPGSSEIEEQGLTSKDISYYKGKLKVEEFIAESLVAGKPLRQIYNYMMQAMFDPTDSRHREVVDEYGVRL